MAKLVLHEHLVLEKEAGGSPMNSKSETTQHEFYIPHLFAELLNEQHPAILAHHKKDHGLELFVTRHQLVLKEKTAEIAQIWTYCFSTNILTKNEHVLENKAIEAFYQTKVLWLKTEMHKGLITFHLEAAHEQPTC